MGIIPPGQFPVPLFCKKIVTKPVECHIWFTPSAHAPIPANRPFRPHRTLTQPIYTTVTQTLITYRLSPIPCNPKHARPVAAPRMGTCRTGAQTVNIHFVFAITIFTSNIYDNTIRPEVFSNIHLTQRDISQQLNSFFSRCLHLDTLPKPVHSGELFSSLANFLHRARSRRPSSSRPSRAGAGRPPFRPVVFSCLQMPPPQGADWERTKAERIKKWAEAHTASLK